jgi:hypothetical protein
MCCDFTEKSVAYLRHLDDGVVLNHASMQGFVAWHYFCWLDFGLMVRGAVANGPQVLGELGRDRKWGDAEPRAFRFRDGSGRCAAEYRLQPRPDPIPAHRDTYQHGL